jgi:DNA-binding CsgD family transcriptional regulator
MSARSKKGGFSKGVIASSGWYATLAELCGGTFTTSTLIGLADELVRRLSVDSILMWRYPQGAAPQLLYGRAEPAGLIDEICFRCGDSVGGHLTLSLGRTVGGDRFTKAEHEAARAIAPLVTAALRSTWRALSPEGVAVRDGLRSEHHLHIENARRNFGRSVLTQREFEILQHLLHGKSVDFIARRLDIAASTVKVHRKHIYSKLNINSQAEIFTLLLEAVGATKYEPGRDPLAAYRKPQG